MKHRSALALVILLALAGTASAAPSLKLSDDSFDFGIVPQNARISHVFWVKSNGPDTLHISKVVPGCGCTQAPLERNVLAAGDSTRLEIIFATGSYTNSVTKSPRIETDAVPPVTNVHIKAFVASRPDSTYPLVVKPYKLDLTATEDESRTATFTLVNMSDSPLRPKLVSRDPRLISVTLPNVIPAGGSAEGAVKLTRAAMEKELTTSFTIQLNDEKSTRFTVPVRRDAGAIPSGIKTSSR